MMVAVDGQRECTVPDRALKPQRKMREPQTSYPIDRSGGTRNWVPFESSSSRGAWYLGAMPFSVGFRKLTSYELHSCPCACTRDDFSCESSLCFTRRSHSNFCIFGGDGDRRSPPPCKLVGSLCGDVNDCHKNHDRIPTGGISATP